MSGYYSRTIVFEIDTPLKNDFPRRGVRFEHGRSARIDVKHNKELSPLMQHKNFRCHAGQEWWKVERA